MQSKGKGKGATKIRGGFNCQHRKQQLQTAATAAAASAAPSSALKFWEKVLA
jgi:hypothetical protein